MPNQGCHSKRRGGEEQSHQKKRSPDQPHTTSTSAQNAQPTISPQGFNAVSQPLSKSIFWGPEDTEALDWQHDGSDKLGSITSHTTSNSNAETPSGEIMNKSGGYMSWSRARRLELVPLDLSPNRLLKMLPDRGNRRTIPHHGHRPRSSSLKLSLCIPAALRLPVGEKLDTIRTGNTE
jgi:hypothetical protein